MKNNMKIEAIEKYKGRIYKVSFDECEDIFLHEEIIFEYNLKVGLKLPFDALSDIKNSSDKRRARERALYLLTIRDYSYIELYNKLCKNYSEEICIETCNLMVKKKLIDDRIYGERLTREYIEVKKYGEYRVRMELRRKGISEGIIEELLSVYDNNTIERLYNLVEKKYTRYLTDYKGIQKVKSALARQGYSYSDINAVFDEFDDRTDN